MTESNKESFREAVRAYIEIHDELTKSGRQLRELRKQKELIGQTVLEWMKTNEIDECELPDGKLVKKTSKRTEGMKKEYVIKELTTLANGDEARALASLQNIMSMRSVVEKDILSRTTKKA